LSFLPLILLFSCNAPDEPPADDTDTEGGFNTAPPGSTPGDDDDDDDDDDTDDTDTDTDTTPTSLTEAEFVVLFPDRLCTAYANCNPNIQCDGSAADLAPECTFHDDAAAACVYGDFTCNNQFGQGFEFIEVPLACGQVYTNCPGYGTGGWGGGTGGWWGGTGGWTTTTGP